MKNKEIFMDRQAYINDIRRLELPWESGFDVPPEMLDFDEKYRQMLTPDGRLMSCLHRGDSGYFPESSIEAIISAIRMGADMIEIDPRRTKDGVFVLSHDILLNRMTDYSDKCGKNGLPESPYIYDWTYEQLTHLNYKDRNGGNAAPVTPFRIATLEEAVKVAANRVFIRLDIKANIGPGGDGSIWDFENDIWPLEKKYGSYDNILFTWHQRFSENGFLIPKKYKALQKECGGRGSVSFTGICRPEDDSVSVLIDAINEHGLDPCVRLNDFKAHTDIEQYIDEHRQRLEALKGMVRMYIDVPKTSDCEKTWEYLNGAGINVLLVNHGYDMCRFIAEKYFD